MAGGFRDFGEMDTYPVAIARRAEWSPDRTYLEEIGRGSLSFAQVHTAALTWADALRRAGVAAGDRVVVMLPPCLEGALVWLGLAWLKAWEVPINTAFLGESLRYLLADSGARVVVVHQRYLAAVSAAAAELPSPPLLLVFGAGDLPAGGPVPMVALEPLLAAATPATDLAAPQPWDVAGVMYTSGTTGPAKGVVIPWGMWRAGSEFASHLGPDDAWYLPFPLFHALGKSALVTMGFCGGRVVIREQLSVKAFWEDMDTYRCTTAVLVPAIANWLLSQPPGPQDAQHSLRQVNMIGQTEAFRQRFGVSISTMFGMTEVGNILGRHQVIGDAISCGRPLPGYEVHLVDDHDYPVPDGQVGELIVRAERPWCLNLGYIDKPRENMEAWRNGWFHTGDAFRRDTEGNFFFVDRKRDYIRRRGEKISSFQVEALVAQHPDVAEVVAIPVPSEHGEDEVKVVVVKKPDRELMPEALIEYLTPRMPRFMLPRYVEFVATLPKTDATLRVQKVKLRVNPLNAQTWDREAEA